MPSDQFGTLLEAFTPSSFNLSSLSVSNFSNRNSSSLILLESFELDWRHTKPYTAQILAKQVKIPPSSIKCFPAGSSIRQAKEFPVFCGFYIFDPQDAVNQVNIDQLSTGSLRSWTTWKCLQRTRSILIALVGAVWTVKHRLTEHAALW